MYDLRADLSVYLVSGGARAGRTRWQKPRSRAVFHVSGMTAKSVPIAAALAAYNAEPKEQLAELLGRLGRNSRNSGKPAVERRPVQAEDAERPQARRPAGPSRHHAEAVRDARPDHQPSSGCVRRKRRRARRRFLGLACRPPSA